MAAHLPAADLARWDAVALEQALARMEDVVVCRCGTPCLEDADHMVHCPACLWVSCAICREAYHPGREVRSCPAALQSLWCLSPARAPVPQSLPGLAAP